jgi:hypothetical protein
MLTDVIYAAAAKSPKVLDATNRAGAVVAEAYCLPAKAQNALDTAQLWTLIVAIALGSVSLVMIGIGWWFSSRGHDGGEMFKSLGKWIGGAVLIGGASGIATVFLGSVSSNCQTVPGT